MDQSNVPQNRRSPRSNVLMQASLELSGTSLPVKLRNLSEDGALVEADKLPVEGSAIVFRRGDLSVPGRVAWVKGGHAGIGFTGKLNPDQVMRHIPQPQARTRPDFRRPGLRSRDLTAEEKRFAEQWLHNGAAGRLGE